MSDAYMTALQYLTPARNTFWRWAEGIAVVVWNDEDRGSTIAFAPEVQTVIERLDTERLPPIDVIVLLMSACRDNWLGEGRDVISLVDALAIKPTATTRMWAEEVVHRLHRVSELPRELRTNAQAKAELAAIVFERFPVKSQTVSSEVVLAAWNEGLTIVDPSDERTPEWTGGPLTVTLQAMADGLDRVDAESLAVRLRTGLDTLPTRLELPLYEQPEELVEPPLTVRELLDEQKDDAELGGLVRLARNLMAVVHLPRAIVDHEDLPMGGVSDITNRGPLDRLLLSELAYDDATLMTRVALNEALYLRRETPPAEPPRQRVLLLDNGLRMWGVPRVFQTAVALSLAATTDTHTQTLAFRAEGDDVVPVELRTREGLLAHLEALRPEAHPGRALDRFAASYDSEQTDVVLVTGEDVLADVDFRRQLNESDLGPVYLASVSRTGRFQLSVHSPRGDKPLKEALLDVNKLLEAPARPVLPLIDHSRSIAYPAILRVDPFPLLLTHADREQATWHVSDYGTLVLTHDRRLMRWDNGKQGAMQLTDTAPKGDLLWWDVTRDCEHVRAVIGRQHNGRMWLLTLRLDDDHCSVTDIDLQHPYFLRVCEHGGVLFIIREGMVDVHSLDDGSHLKSMVIPQHHTLKGGRFFTSWNAWHALSYDGVTAHLEEVPTGDIPFEKIVTVFDSRPAHGPVALQKDGCFYFTHDETAWRPKIELTNIDHHNVSHDGRRVQLLSTKGRRGHSRYYSGIVDLETREVLSQYETLEADVPSDLRNLPLRNIRTRFQSIGVVDGSNLVLTSRRGVKWKIVLRKSLNVDASTKNLKDLPPKEALSVGIQQAGREKQGDQLKLVMITSAEAARVRNVRTFEQMRPPSDVGYRLHQAVWKDGSRAILDSRGLLHLKSSDASIPEVTLVLSELEVAIWVSDGRMWGSSYHLGDRHFASDLQDIVKTVLAPFTERIT